MPHNKKESKVAPAATARAAKTATPAGSAANPNETALLFWIQQTLRPMLVVPQPVATEAGPLSVAETTQGGGGRPPTVAKGQKPSPKGKKRARTASPPAEAAVVTSTEEAARPPPSDGDAATTMAARALPAEIIVRDVMPFFGHLLDGLLGPVALDVQLLGQTSLLRDPAGFQRTLEHYEQASSGPLQGLLASVKPFFFTRSSGFYTMDTAAYPVLPALASVLATPRVQKVVANASLLYRLLFLFLGTDRVAVEGVVDIGSWNTVLRQSAATSAAQRALLLPVTASDATLVAAQLLAALPAEVRTLLAAQAGNVTARSGAQRIAVGFARRGEATEKDGEDDSGLTPPARSAPAPAAQPPTIGEAGLDDPHLQQLLSSVTPPHRHRRRALSVPSDDARDLAATFSDLGAAFFYYDRFLQPLEHSGIAAGGGGGSSSAARTVGDVCASRTYAAFLCAVMGYHGVYVDRERYERYSDHLTEQIAQLAAAGAGLVDGSQQQHESGTDTHTAAAAVPAATAASFAFTASTTAADLVAYLAKALGQYSGLRGAVAAAVPSGGALAKKHVQQLWEQLSAGPPLHAAEGTARAAAAQLCYIWLAMQERAEYRSGALGKLFRGLGSHLRISLPPSPSSAAGDGAAVDAVMPAYSVHPIWSVHGQSTGRIFCSAPNLQTIPKDAPSAQFHFDKAVATTGTEEAAEMVAAAAGLLFNDHPAWSLRQLYTAPAGCTLVSLDFNQIELRVLAHLSRDPALIASLSADGAADDVLAGVARTVFRHGTAAGVTAEQRQAVKVIVYGLIYGMGPELLDQRLAAAYAKAPQATPADPPADPQRQRQQTTGTPRPPNAHETTAALYTAFPVMRGYLRNSRLGALHEKRTETLSGPKDLSDERDPNRRKQRAVAWAVQGGAADVLHAAMRAVHERRHSLVPFLPAAPVALLLTVHDELVYAVPTGAIGIVVPQLRGIVEGQGRALGLRVPLRVSVKCGPSLGDLKPFEQ